MSAVAAPVPAAAGRQEQLDDGVQYTERHGWSSKWIQDARALEEAGRIQEAMDMLGEGQAEVERRGLDELIVNQHFQAYSKEMARLMALLEP